MKMRFPYMKMRFPCMKIKIFVHENDNVAHKCSHVKIPCKKLCAVQLPMGRENHARVEILICMKTNFISFSEEILVLIH